jgi:DNA-binding NarL/FixJ family response regulator
MNLKNTAFSEEEPIRIVLIDVYALSRNSSRLLLDTLPGLRVVGEAGEHEEALALVTQLQPHMVIVGMRVKGSSGPETARQIANTYPQVKILFMTLFDEPEYIKTALASGAHGYVLKQEPAAELLKAIEGVMEGGGVYLSPGLKLNH